MLLPLQLAVLLALAQIGVEEPASIKDSPERRLQYMQETGSTYKVLVKRENQLIPATFQTKPVLRFTNPVSGVIDGGLFLWRDASKRPVAAAQIFIIPNTEDVWLHEFQSLSTDPMSFNYQNRPVWTPSSAGVKFKPITAPAPTKTPHGRLAQMRRIANRFTVKDDFEGTDEDRLRLMSTPIARYRDQTTIDAAVFVFAHGTDPELFVIVEARSSDSHSATTNSTAVDKETPDSKHWYVALAPMTSYALKARLDDHQYWSVPWRKEPIPITATFKNFIFPPARN